MITIKVGLANSSKYAAARFICMGILAFFNLSACNRSVSQAEMESHFTSGSGIGPNWLFVPGGHINFDAGTADKIKNWLVERCNNWKPASIYDFVSTKTQILTDNSGLEIDGERLVLSFERNKDDADSTVYMQRRISLEERAFWIETIAQIKTQASGKLSGD